MTSLPADTHVHSEWSWDAGSDPASAGTLEATCRHAEAIGLSTLIFTEHLDLETSWRVDDRRDLGEHAHRHVADDGYVRLPAFDLDGYLDAIDRSRQAHPALRILTGVEFGQPHLWDDQAAPILTSGAIDRVNGSLHMLPFPESTTPGDRSEPITLYRHRPAEEVMTAYLEEVHRMVAGSDSFAVFTHLDYAARTWPADTAGPFDPGRFEDGFRAAMRSIARADRALELNTRRLQPWMPQWWAEEGGRAISFGSDAHSAGLIASGFREAMAMADTAGFRPGSRPEDFWTR